MSRPQQPELARSAKTDLDPDHVETGLQGQRKPKADGPTGPVPPENAPGHHPPEEQDKPDLDAFAAKLGTDPKAPTATGARKAAPAKSTPAKADACQVLESLAGSHESEEVRRLRHRPGGRGVPPKRTAR